MELATQDGKKGYGQDGMFYPAEDFEQGIQDGKKGVLHKATKQFYPIDEAQTKPPAEDRIPRSPGQKTPLSSVPGRALENLPGSAVEFGKNIGSVIAAGPTETAKNIVKIPIGGVEKAVDVIAPGRGPTKEIPAFDAFTKAISDRYGGWENIKHTMATDPVGFLADVSSLLEGGGALAGRAGLKTVASTAAKTAELTNPVSLASKGVAAGANAVSKTGTPEWFYQRTMKMPPGSLSDADRGAVLKTLVRDEKLPLGRGTVEKMNTTIKDLDTGISSAIDSASQKGEVVDVTKLTQALDNFKNSKEVRRRLDAKAAAAAIDKTKQAILDHSFNKNGQLSLADAHDLKKGIYEEIQSYYMKQQKPETGRIGVRNEMDARAMAETAKTLRTEVLNNPEIPDAVRAAMQREAGLMNARKWVERATNRAGNLDPVGLSGMLFGVLVEQGIPGAAAWRIATSQPVMSRLAIALGKTRKGLSPTAPNVLYQAGKTSESTKVTNDAGNQQ